jgi:hypothetical protein
MAPRCDAMSENAKYEMPSSIKTRDQAALVYYKLRTASQRPVHAVEADLPLQ